MRWFLGKSAFLLALFVLLGLVLGWFLPGTRQLVVSLAYGQIIMAIVVLAQESVKMSGKGA